MASDNTILGLRAQIAGKITALNSTIQANARTANMKALDIDSTAEIVTIKVEDKWRALIMQNLQVLYHFDESFDTVEAALMILLEMISGHLYQQVKDQLTW